MAQHKLPAEGEGVTGGVAIALRQAPPLLSLVYVSRRQMMPGRGVLEEAGEVLSHRAVLRVVGAVALRLGRNHFDRGQFKGVGRGGVRRGGQGQLVVVVMMVVMMVSQARLHVPRELDFGHSERHLMGVEGGAGCHVITPELKHPR